MPTYEYACRDCGIRFERVQKITEDPLSECDACDGPVFRIIQPVGIAFRGSGFHINDYNKNGNGRSNGKPCEAKESASSSDSGSDTKTEVKCEAKCDKVCPAKAD